MLIVNAAIKDALTSVVALRWSSWTDLIFAAILSSVYHEDLFIGETGNWCATREIPLPHFDFYDDSAT
jgi:hypothetical protein